MADEFVTVQQFGELQTTIKALAGQVHQLVTAKAPPVEPATPEPAKQAPVDPMQANVSAQAFSEMQAQLTHQVSQIQELQRENLQLKAEHAKVAQQRERDQVVNFVENMASDSERKIKPAEKQAKIQLLMAMPNVEQDFADPASGRTMKATPRQMMMDQIKDGPELWSSGNMPMGPEFAPEFTEQANLLRIDMSEVDHESMKLDKKVRAYMSEHNIEDYIEAYDRYTLAAGITE